MSRGIKLFTLYLDCFAQTLDALGVLSRLPCPKQCSSQGAEDCEPASNPKRMGRK